MWPFVRQALEDEVLAGNKYRHVTFGGYSMGAAVATLLSYASQRFLDSHRAGVTVSAVLIASPNGEDSGRVAGWLTGVGCLLVGWLADWWLED